MPSKRILDEICEDGNPIVRYTRFPPNEDLDKLVTGFCSFANGILYGIAEHFKWGLDIKGEMNTQKVASVFEAWSNAFAHGSRNKNSVDFGLFLGEKGVCYGFRDYGDYFKSEEVKQIYETKTQIETFGDGLKELSGFNIGVSWMYDDADIIEVDTNLGVLYLVQYKSSLAKE